MIQLETTIRCEDYIHFRPATIIKNICDLFPDTSFLIQRADSIKPSLQKVNPKWYLNLVTACLLSGEKVTVTAEGPHEQLAAAFIQGILENLNVVYANAKSQSPDAIKEKIANFLGRIVRENLDPQRHIVLGLVDEKIRGRPSAAARVPAAASHSIEVPVTANLHGAVVEVLPRIARHFASVITLAFRHPTAGDLEFDVSGDNAWVIFDILAFTPPIGTRLTVRAYGERCQLACEFMARMIGNLAKADAWIHICVSQQKTDAELVEGIEKVIDADRTETATPDAPTKVREYMLNDLLKKELIVFGREPTDRLGAIEALSATVSAYGGMDATELKDLVNMWSERVNVCSDRFAYVHARAKNCPPAMFALGVFAQGVEWPGQEERKQVVALLLAATDVGETFIGYMGRLLGIFRKNQPLIDALVAAHTPEEVVGILKRADAAAQDAREKKRREKARVVLLVESIEDEITVGRQEILAKSPRIRGYRIEYIYAVRESAQGAPDFNEAEFAQRLSARIADLKPQFVLFHTGHIYQQHISWFEDLVRGLRGRFGDVRFGYQEKRSLASPEGVFSYDDETKGIQTLVFRNILGI